jgi:hypothetical protein
MTQIVIVEIEWTGRKKAVQDAIVAAIDDLMEDDLPEAGATSATSLLRFFVQERVR